MCIICLKSTWNKFYTLLLACASVTRWPAWRFTMPELSYVLSVLSYEITIIELRTCLHCRPNFFLPQNFTKHVFLLTRGHKQSDYLISREWHGSFFHNMSSKLGCLSIFIEMRKKIKNTDFLTKSVYLVFQ